MKIAPVQGENPQPHVPSPLPSGSFSQRGIKLGGKVQKRDFCCQPLWPCAQYTFNKPLCLGINKKEKRKQPTPYFCRVRRKEPCDFAKGKARFRGLRVILPLMEHWWTSLLDDHFKKGCYISITLFQNSIYRNRIQA